MQNLWQHLKETEKPIVLYGMGNGADKIITVLEEKGIAFQGVFASDGFVRDKYFHNHKITDYKTAKNTFGDMIVLLCFGSERPEVIENVKRIASVNELYAPDVPVISDGLFDMDYVRKHRAELEAVYNLLADDLSKKTFENVIKFKISGKIDYLLDCATDNNEPYNSFLRLNNSEHFVDLGAYNGDTVLEFINRVENCSKITAVEADSKTFKKLLKNTENIENITCKNVCVSDFTGKGLFGMLGGRNSNSSTLKTEADFITVDHLLGENGATFIKMDIEGEELKAIKGAEKTIRDYKPKMLISAYHRNEDLITLPKAVLDINPNYKIYMRHFSALPAWDINYYFI